MVIAYYMVKKAYDEGFAKGYVEGFAEGRAEAFADINRQNAAYYKRMQEATERGEDFNEPPPRFGNQQDRRLACNAIPTSQEASAAQAESAALRAYSLPLTGTPASAPGS